MNLINSVLATFQFELSRMMTVQRVCLAMVMALFPPAMIYVLIRTQVDPPPEIVISVFCGMICLLSLLLWATPNVYAELEGRNWTFVVSSPNGRWSIVFGKFLVAFTWSFLVSWIAMSLCMLIVDPNAFGQRIDGPRNSQILEFESGQSVEIPGYLDVSEEDVEEAFEQAKEKHARGEGERSTVEEETVQILFSGNRMAAAEKFGWDRYVIPFRVWVVFTVLLFLASMVYAAIFSFVGVLIQRRAMVFSVGYFLLFEVVLSFIPANIGKLAMTYHLFCIGTTWLPWYVPGDVLDGLGDRYGVFPLWLHFAAIFLATAMSLAAAAFVIQKREYITLEDANI